MLSRENPTCILKQKWTGILSQKGTVKYRDRGRKFWAFGPPTFGVIAIDRDFGC